MTTEELDQIASLRVHFDEQMDKFQTRVIYAAWSIALIVIGSVTSVVLHEISQENRITDAQAEVEQTAADANENRADIKALVQQFSVSNREISAMSAQIAAQGRTLERVDDTLSELLRYFREGR